MAAAGYGGNAPWDLVESQICEMLHKFPSEVREEPTDDIIRMLRLLGLYNEHYNPRAHEKTSSSFELGDT